jgi:hypothetical protein
MPNLVVHFEIHASDPDRLIAFYSQLLGWSFQRFGEMDYWAIDTGEGAITPSGAGHGINGGLTRRQGPAPEVGGAVNGANIVIGVDDVDGLFAKGLELGGTEALAPSDMPGVGRLAYLQDPDHNIFGMISPVLSDGTNVMGS